MNAAEIVVGEMQGYRSLEMRQLLAERICQARKTSACHAKGQVLPFDLRRAEMSRIGIACDDSGYCLPKSWWGVPSATWGTWPVHLPQLREVNRLAKRRIHGESVRTPTVCRQLRMQTHAVREYRSRINVIVFAVVRFPVSQEKTSFVSASMPM